YSICRFFNFERIWGLCLESIFSGKPARDYYCTKDTMIVYIVGLVVSLACGLWFIYSPPRNRFWIHWLLSAGGAYLIAILFTHILPELFEELGSKAGLVLLIGF